MHKNSITDPLSKLPPHPPCPRFQLWQQTGCPAQMHSRWLMLATCFPPLWCPVISSPRALLLTKRSHCHVTGRSLVSSPIALSPLSLSLYLGTRHGTTTTAAGWNKSLPPNKQKVALLVGDAGISKATVGIEIRRKNGPLS